jgi:hypothetical protein
MAIRLPMSCDDPRARRVRKTFDPFFRWTSPAASPSPQP